MDSNEYGKYLLRMVDRKPSARDLTNETDGYLIIRKIRTTGLGAARAPAPVANVTALDYPEIDLADAIQVRTLVRTHQPQAIINATAYTAVDRAESEPEIATAINARAPGLLAKKPGAWVRSSSIIPPTMFSTVIRAAHTWKATSPIPWEYTGRASSRESGIIQAAVGIP